MSGATQTEFNGTFVVVVTGLKSFTYTIIGNPVSPATGTPVADVSFANIEAESDSFGVLQNLESGSRITLSSPIAGVDSEGFVSFDELSGGADTESDLDLRNRLLFRLQNPITLFNDANITLKAREVPGTTRVFIQGPDDADGTVIGSLLKRVEGGLAIFLGASPHGLQTGQNATILGANQPEYNVTSKILVLGANTFEVPPLPPRLDL